MSELRKAFRGYHVGDVDQRLSELENQLAAATSRCTELERQLSEARRSADELQSRLSAREAELHRVSRAYEQITAEQSGKKSAEESIGHIYIKAFENDRDVVLSPREHVDQFLSNVEGAAQRARVDLAAAQRDFSGISDQIVNAVSQINGQTQAILERLKELSAHVDGIDHAYAGFDRVRQATHAEICEIQSAYEQSVGLYLDGLNDSGRPARTAVPAAAPSFHAAPEQMTEPPVKKTRQLEDVRPTAPVIAPEVRPTAVGAGAAGQVPAAEMTPQQASIPTHTPPAEQAPSPAAEEARHPAPDGTPAVEAAPATVDSGPATPGDVGVQGGTPASAPEPEAPPAAAAKSTALPMHGEKADVRGQHILDLLHKYQKR